MVVPVLLLQLLLAWLCPSAWALDARLVLTEGATAPGAEVPVEVLLLDGAGLSADSELRAEARRGQVGRVSALGEGRWSLRYRAPAEGSSDRLLLSLGDQSIELTLPLGLDPVVAVPLPASAIGQTGRPLSLPLPDLDPAAVERFEAAVPEGVVLLRAAASGGVELLWTPGPEPFPRAVPVALWDRDRPLRPPSFSVLRLSGRPRIPIQVTEVGTSVSLRVGGRRYGPFIAGSDKIAQASAEVRPGESTAEVILEDPAGNSQSTVVALGGDRRPALLAVARPAGPGSARAAVVDLFAITDQGGPWKGRRPPASPASGSPSP